MRSRSRTSTVRRRKLRLDSEKTGHARRDLEQEATELRAAQDEWIPGATFVIEFLSKTSTRMVDGYRTHVHHHEEHRDVEWQGIAGSQALRWMLNQLSAPLDVAPRSPARTSDLDSGWKASANQGPLSRVGRRRFAISPKRTSSPKTWRIVLVRMVRTAGPPFVTVLFRSGQARPAVVPAGLAYILEFHLDAASMDPIALDRVHRPDGIRIYGRDSSSGISTDIWHYAGAGAQTDRGTCTMRIGMSPFAFPGTYRLRCAPIVHGAVAKHAAITIPLLRVVDQVAPA